MAIDTLFPIDDCHLQLKEIIERLKDEFRFVVVDKEKGKEEISSFLNYLYRRKDKGGDLGGISIDEHIMGVESQLDEAVSLVISDVENPGDAMLSTTLVPGKPISFGYYSVAEDNRRTGKSHDTQKIERLMVAIHFFTLAR